MTRRRSPAATGDLRTERCTPTKETASGTRPHKEALDAAIQPRAPEVGQANAAKSEKPAVRIRP